MTNQLVGASVWEQSLYDHLTEHENNERELLLEYQQAASGSQSAAFRYLAGLIVEDEIRHHRVLKELADSLRLDAEMHPGDPTVPRLGGTVDECADLLRAHRFGRLAVHGPGGLAIFPVNYVYSDGHVAIRTDPGTKLSAAAQSEVAFEIDGVDEESHDGWSVLVQGAAYDVTDSVDRASAAMRQLPVEPWAGPKSRWLRIEPSHISGRMVRPAPTPA